MGRLKDGRHQPTVKELVAPEADFLSTLHHNGREIELLQNSLKKYIFIHLHLR